jgi:hypothetical protein
MQSMKRVALLLAMSVTAFAAFAGSASAKPVKIPTVNFILINNAFSGKPFDKDKEFEVLTSWEFAVPAKYSLTAACKGKVKFRHWTKSSGTIKRFSANLKVRTFDHSCVAGKFITLKNKWGHKFIKTSISFEGNSVYKPYSATERTEVNAPL